MNIDKLADHNHVLVKKTALELTQNQTSDRDKLEKLFLYVRDHIKFGFPTNGDIVKASETIQLKIGQCNTKGTLLAALARAVDIPARLHYSLIDKEIQKGLFGGLLYRIMPKLLSHAYVEVKIEGQWRKIDSYINDQGYYLQAKQELKHRGWETGFSVACSKGESSIDFSLDKEKFVQMDAVVKDQGIWDEPEDYFNSSMYHNRPNWFILLIYRMIIGRINRRISYMRCGDE